MQSRLKTTKAQILNFEAELARIKANFIAVLLTRIEANQGCPTKALITDYKDELEIYKTILKEFKQLPLVTRHYILTHKPAYLSQKLNGVYDGTIELFKTWYTELK